MFNYTSINQGHHMRILIIDNGGQWTHREWRVVRDLGADAAMIPNTTPVEKIDADGIVLSGGSPRVGVNINAMGLNGKYLDELKIPILGICAGIHFMTVHFGGKAAPSKNPEFGKMKIYVDDPDVLFAGLPKTFIAWESHNDEVQVVPEGFKVMAHSDNTAVQAIRCLKKPIFGLQFHPEVEHTEHGYDIFSNFLALCKK